MHKINLQCFLLGWSFHPSSSQKSRSRQVPRGASSAEKETNTFLYLQLLGCSDSSTLSFFKYLSLYVSIVTDVTITSRDDSQCISLLIKLCLYWYSGTCLMVSPSWLLTVSVLSSLPRASRFWLLQQPQVILFECLPSVYGEREKEKGWSTSYQQES